MQNKKQFKNREEKLAYLKGLRDGTRKLAEITEPRVIILVSRNDQPGIVVNELTGKVMTEEEADVIRNKEYKDTIVGRRDGIMNYKLAGPHSLCTFVYTGTNIEYFLKN